MTDQSTRLAEPATSPAAQEHVVLRLRLIGQMAALTIGGDSVLPAGRKTRALLASIAIAAPRPMLRGRLAEQLWSRRPDEQARASLRQEIHRLLEALSPVQSDILLITRDHLTLHPGSVWVDVHEVMRATAEQPASLGLMDGDLLEGLDGIDPAFDAWLNAERERLRDRARTIAEGLLRDGQEPDAAITAAQRLLSIDRSHEGAWRALMRAYAAQGERGLAVQAYDRCRAVLADSLDAAPSPETQRLLNEIRGPSHARLTLRPPQTAETEPPADKTPLPGQTPRPAPPDPDGPLPNPHDLSVTPSSASIGVTRLGAHIGVMPFRPVGLSGGDEHLAPGLADEITNALSRFRWMVVISANSLARFAADKRDEAAIRQAFGLDFLLDGSIQRADYKIRISLRVLDLRANNQIVWARRFDREANNPLSLQDEIAAEVAAQLDPELLLIEARRSMANGSVDTTAYDHVLRSIPLIWRMQHEPFMQAGTDLAQAIEQQPDYAPAYAWYAYWHAIMAAQYWACEPASALEKASQMAERSIVLDPFDALGLTIGGHVKACLRGRLREAKVLHERALSLNPNLAMAWALSAITYARAGDPEEAEQRAKHYKALSPMDPNAVCLDPVFVLIHLMKRDYEAAADYGRTLSQLHPSVIATYRPYLAALGHLRRDQEAAGVRRFLLAQEPEFTIARFLDTCGLERENDRTHYAEGLRKAGIRDRDPIVIPAE